MSEFQPNQTDRRNRSERGASLIEISIVIPFVLFGILIMIWLGLTIHANTSLESALTRSLRLAATRGVAENTGAQIISAVQNWEEPRISDLLIHNVDPTDAMAYYDTMTANIFGNTNTTLKSLPPEYIYALVYLNESMKQSIGGGIRFPCKADDAESGVGCLDCSFLNPTSLEASFDGTPKLYTDQPPRRSMGLECHYQPSDSLVAPLSALIRLISGSGSKPLVVLKKRQYLDMPSM